MKRKAFYFDFLHAFETFRMGNEQKEGTSKANVLPLFSAYTLLIKAGGVYRRNTEFKFNKNKILLNLYIFVFII